MATASLPAARLRAESGREFRLVYTVAFVYFLAIALVVRLLPRAWRPNLPGGRSILHEARETANAFVPFAFMR